MRGFAPQNDRTNISYPAGARLIMSNRFGFPRKKLTFGDASPISAGLPPRTARTDKNLIKNHTHHVPQRNIRPPPERAPKEDRGRPRAAAGQRRVAGQLSEQSVPLPSGQHLPILLRPEPSRLRRADGYRLGRGNALRRRLHDRRHHLDGSATDPRRAGPGGRHRQDAAAVAARQADRSGRRQGAQGPFPASLPGRNDAADRPAARSRARAGSALRLGRAGQGGRSPARSAARCTAWL